MGGKIPSNSINRTSHDLVFPPEKWKWRKSKSKNTSAQTLITIKNVESTLLCKKCFTVSDVQKSINAERCLRRGTELWTQYLDLHISDIFRLLRSSFVAAFQHIRSCNKYLNFFFFFFESLRGLLKALFSNCYHANKLASFVNHMQRIPKQECTVYIVQWVQYTCMCVCVCSAAEAYSTCFTFLISTIPWDEWTWYDLKHTGVHILLSYWPMFLITYTASPDTWTNDSLSHLASWITKQ